MSQAAQSKNQRWYPSSDQLKDPTATERAFRQLLKQHYDLQDQVAGIREQLGKSTTPKPSGPPPGSGPSDTILLGLHVAPIDTSTLADGAVLKYSKANGNLHFA
jgi:hypothetical protein